MIGAKNAESANNTVAETIGQIQALLSLAKENDAGSSRVFDVLPGLPCEVLLGEDTVIESEAFTTHGGSFVELPPGSGEPLKLYLIFYIGKKACGVWGYFFRRRRLGARGNLPRPSAAKMRDDFLNDSLLERYAAEVHMPQQQDNPGGAESGTDADAAQVVDARLLGEGLCTGIERC